MRSTHDARGGLNPLMDHVVGTAYDDVRCVAQNIAIIKQLSYHMESIYNTSGNIEEIVLLAQAIGNLANSVVITANPANGLIGGSLQNVLNNLSQRIKALES